MEEGVYAFSMAAGYKSYRFLEVILRTGGIDEDSGAIEECGLVARTMSTGE
jgi:hypothetical protein